MKHAETNNSLFKNPHVFTGVIESNRPGNSICHLG